MTGSMALFAVEDMFLKLVATDLPAGEVIFFAGLAGALTFAVVARIEGRRVLTPMALHPAVTARNLGEMIATIGYIIGLATLPLATVSAVLQAMPLAVTLGAVLFMGEKVGWRRWMAICVGFAGVLLVIRPGMAGFQWQALLVLASIAGLALRDLATRRTPPEASTAQISAWGLMAVTVLGLMMMLWDRSVVLPDARQAMWMLGGVLFGTAGYWAITAATRHGDISVIAPFRYSRLLFALIFAVTVFSERPDVITLTGAALIIGSGLYAFARERARQRALSMDVPAL
ncbi:DMT family transporter [Tabrizicola sp. J26]|nr:DMT family transporter [Tabrizicola rongguiensis]